MINDLTERFKIAESSRMLVIKGVIYPLCVQIKYEYLNALPPSMPIEEKRKRVSCLDTAINRVRHMSIEYFDQ